VYIVTGGHVFPAIEKDKVDDLKKLFQASNSFTQRPVKMHKKQVNGVTTPDKKIV